MYVLRRNKSAEMLQIYSAGVFDIQKQKKTIDAVW